MVGGRSRMCKTMEERINRDRLNIIKSLSKNLSLSEERIVASMNISEEEKKILLERLAVNSLT